MSAFSVNIMPAKNPQTIVFWNDIWPQPDLSPSYRHIA